MLDEVLIKALNIKPEDRHESVQAFGYAAIEAIRRGKERPRQFYSYA